MMTDRLIAVARRAASRSARRCVQAVLVAAATASVFGLAGCSSGTPVNNASNEPGATFGGERYLYGTINSFGNFVNNRPRYVGGYGMVVDLNATGSNEVPAFLREWLANEMRRNNLGSVQYGTQSFSPQRVMSDTGSAVVAVEGLIPPGAPKGSKFDILVTMIDQTSTSLAGGRLFWPVQMSVSGLDRRLIYTESEAAGYGPLYINPVAPPDGQGAEFLRQGVVINGGTVLADQRVEFVLNAESRKYANAIAERINARFEALDNDNLPTAVAKNGMLIQINIPQRFEGQPSELLDLIGHMYLDPTPAFVRPQAAGLVKALREAPSDRRRSVTLAWKMLGPNVIPVLRELYDDPDPDTRNAALDAGAWLQDEKTLEPLSRMARLGEPEDRVFAARSLVVLTRSNEARRVVRGMLNDPDPAVRIGAYEALTLVSDPSIERVSIDDGAAHKFYIDRVPSDYPLVYATQGDDLAVVIFGRDLGFRRSVYAKIDERLTIQTLPATSIPVGLRGRYEGDTAFIPVHRSGNITMIQSIEPVSNDPDAPLAEPDWQVEVGDADGNAMVINIRDPRLQDVFGAELMRDPGRGTASTSPRAVALVRVVKGAGKDEQGEPTPAVGELLQLRDPDAPMPLAVRYLAPGEREPKVYRVSPTVATLAYTLGYKRGDHVVQIGPNLTYSKVVHTLYELCRTDQIPAPFQINQTPLAQAISRAQLENRVEARPEMGPDDFINEPAPDDAPGGSPSPAPPEAGGSATPPGDRPEN